MSQNIRKDARYESLLYDFPIEFAKRNKLLRPSLIWVNDANAHCLAGGSLK